MSTDDEETARMDAWRSAVMQLGTELDRVASTRFVRRVATTSQELDALFDYDDIAGKIVTSEPELAMRKGFEVVLDTPEATSAMKEHMKRLEVRTLLEEALVQENVLGGAALYIGIDDGREQDEPVAINNVRAIRFLMLIDRRDLEPLERYDEPLTPQHGKPKTYAMRAMHRSEGGVIDTPVTVHEERLILFRGLPCSNTHRRVNKGWGMSRLDRAYAAMQIFANNWLSATHMMSDACQAIVKIQDLVKMAGSNQKDAGLERMRQVDRQRSVSRAVFLDAASESFEKHDTAFTGVPEMLDRSAQRLSAAAGIPVSILMGREPAGLNATGDADVRAWYDRVEIMQTQRIAPMLIRIAELIMLAVDGPKSGRRPEVTFPPIMTPTPTEKADLELKHATADQIRIDSQVVDPAEVASARWRGGVYQNDLVIDTGDRAAILSALKAPTIDVPAPTPPEDPGIEKDPGRGIVTA